MQVTLPEESIEGIGLTAEDIQLDLALGLYVEKRVTLGRAAHVAGMTQPDFLKKLGALHIPMHYDLPEFEADLMVVRESE